MRPQTYPSTLGQILSNSLRRANLGRIVKESDLIKNWPQIVGPAVAKKASPLSLKGKVLTVEVADATWRYQLSLMKLRLKEQINQAMGEEIVQDLFFIYGPAPLKTQEGRSISKVHPLSRSQKESVSEAVRQTSDLELKEILSSLLEKSLRNPSS